MRKRVNLEGTSQNELCTQRDTRLKMNPNKQLKTKTHNLRAALRATRGIEITQILEQKHRRRIKRNPNQKQSAKHADGTQKSVIVDPRDTILMYSCRPLGCPGAQFGITLASTGGRPRVSTAAHRMPRMGSSHVAHSSL